MSPALNGAGRAKKGDGQVPYLTGKPGRTLDNLADALRIYSR
jgi:hypothetical protein